MIRTLNRWLDGVLGVDSDFVLNDAVTRARPGMNLAAELYRAIHLLQADAYDESRRKFDYARVRASVGYRDLIECATALNSFDPATLSSRHEQLAFWINLYNALVIDAVIRFDVRESVTKDLGFFRRAAYRVCDRRYSADDIENGILRGNRHHPLLFFSQFNRDDPRLAFSIQPIDPRIHAALNCASRSCPPVSVYDVEHIDQQLDQAMRGFVNATTRIDSAHRIIELSPIFRWYAVDFGGRTGVLAWIARALDDSDSRKWLAENDARTRIKYSRYDWSLNG